MKFGPGKKSSHGSPVLGIRYGLLAACVALLTTSAFRRPSGDDDPSTWSLHQWTEWRDRQISKILTPRVDATGALVLDRKDVIARCCEAQSVIGPCLRKDARFFSEDRERAVALKNFISFVSAEARMGFHDKQGRSTHLLGYELSDLDYWRYSADDVAFPDLLKSQTFLQNLSDPAGYRAAVEQIDQQNKALPEEKKWKVLLFKGQFIKSVDQTTYGRLLVVIPNVPAPEGGEMDQWIMFALATPDLVPPPEEMSVSVISVRRHRTETDMNRSSMVDFMRRRDRSTGRIQLVPNMMLDVSPSDNCEECHKSSVIPIHPETELGFDAGGRLVNRPTDSSGVRLTLNRLIVGYGKTEFGPLDPESYGPSLGPTVRERPDSFIAQATKEHPLAIQSYAKLRQAMDCARCHDSFAKINYPLALASTRDLDRFKLREGMVRTYIARGWMPPNNNLSATERDALWRCLIEEYFDPKSTTGLFVDWLKGQ